MKSFYEILAHREPLMCPNISIMNLAEIYRKENVDVHKSPRHFRSKQIPSLGVYVKSLESRKSHSKFLGAFLGKSPPEKLRSEVQGFDVKYCY